MFRHVPSGVLGSYSTPLHLVEGIQSIYFFPSNSVSYCFKQQLKDNKHINSFALFLLAVCKKGNSIKNVEKQYIDI